MSENIQEATITTTAPATVSLDDQIAAALAALGSPDSNSTVEVQVLSAQSIQGNSKSGK